MTLYDFFSTILIYHIEMVEHNMFVYTDHQDTKVGYDYITLESLKLYLTSDKKMFLSIRGTSFSMLYSKTITLNSLTLESDYDWRMMIDNVLRKERERKINVFLDI